MSTSCPFCRIVAGEEPADVLHETETVVAFRDLRPQAPAHILLIPKEHISDLTEIGDDHGAVLVGIVKAAAHLAKTEGIDESGWRLVANVGPDAGQSVFHLHFHLLGGRPMAWPPG
ncbi:MAG: histidine triad nucleotide-binding protein [Actinomycetota bacterium]